MGTNHPTKWLQRCMKAMLAIAIVGMALLPTSASAQSGADFNVQVSPSPLVLTVKPGETKRATITVRNLTNHAETLYPALRSFEVSDKTGQVHVSDNPPADLEEWMTFKQSSLTLAAGGSAPLDIEYNTPKNVGFSYKTAITLKRSPNKDPNETVRLEGGIAIFNLINIDRPDAVRELSIESVTSKQSLYEFLPATFEVSIKNNGNVIAQPSGTVFLQRSFEDDNPLATLELNPAEGYILPGKTRTFTVAWDKGFPLYTMKTVADNAAPERRLSWNWKNISDLRVGRYVAKVVMVYDDGHRQVPVTGSDSFWVMPWRLIGGLVLIIGLIVIGMITSGKLGMRAAKKVRSKVGHHGK